MEDVIVPIPANAQEEANQQNETSRQPDSRQKQLHWTIIKWMTTIILSCAMLVLLVSTKLTFLGLSRYLNSTNSFLVDQVQYETTRILVYFTITTPYWLFLVRAVLMVALTPNNCWPTKSGIFWCVAMGTLEPVGIVIFTFCVLPFTDSLTCLYIMSASISFPVVRVLIQCVRERLRNSHTYQRFLSAVITLGGLSWLVVHVLKMTFNSASDQLVVLAAVSILLVNLAYIPYSCLHVSTQLKYIGDARRFWKRKEVNSTWKSSLIVYFVKSLSTLVASAVVYFIQTPYPYTFSSFKLNFDMSTISTVFNYQFYIHIFAGCGCYLLFLLACRANLKRTCLGLPLVLSFPCAILLVGCNKVCQTIVRREEICDAHALKPAWDIPIQIGFCVCYIVVAIKGLRTHVDTSSLAEKQMFTVPGYGSVLLESWLLVLTSGIRTVVRRSSAVLGERENIKADRVFVCTTMYHESENEMRDYLQSLAELSNSLKPADPEFEAHIIFDDAVSEGNITEFAARLFAVAREVLDFSSIFKEMPYGQQHKCLNISKQKQSQLSKFMSLTIHLKYNSKVLGKKRWSQVMFMNYVTNYKFLNHDDDCSFILTTDGDVSFKPGAVRALIERLQADNSLGAVCSRVIPEGEGPLYWFQSFEYALDHWLQKTTEHVLGSVLCAPGCFSLYRCSAICDVLKTYSLPAQSAMHFLTREMGEDRWLCSLMVQEGCGIDYCQDARVSTHCPTNFEEFFKQRRRWIASSLANVYLLLKDRNKLRLANPRVSEIFLVYQLLHFVTVLLSPTAVLILVAGGMSYAFGAPSYIVYIAIAVIELNFTIFCLKGNHRTQLVVAQFYAILFPALMWAVFVGIIAQLATGSSSSDQTHSTVSLSKTLPSVLLNDSDSGVDFTFTAGYILATFGVILVTGILQGKDCLQLVQGVLFVFSLPCLYMLMSLYTASNLMDLSWGTRQDVEPESEYFIQTWIKLLKSFISFFRCKCNFSLSKPTDLEIPIVTVKEIAELDPSPDKKEEKLTQIKSKPTESADVEEESDEEDEDTDETDGVSSDYVTIDKWLPEHLRIPYAAMFKKQGYTTTNFLTSLTEADLVKLGVDKKGIRMFLMAEIRKLPSFQLKINVKAGVNQFLKDTGLQRYLENFKANCLDTAEALQTLKNFTEDDIKDLGIKKPGHVKRLMSAIAMLRLQDQVYTTEQEDRTAPKIAEGSSATSINVVDEDITTLASPDERDFRAQWAHLIERTLNPDHGNVVSPDTIKENLQRLKINAIKCLIATNAVLFVFTIVLTLFSRFSKVVVGIDPVSFAVLLVFALLMLLQFLGMLIYNLSRFCHNLSRASYRLKRLECLNSSGNENIEPGDTGRLTRGETVSLLRGDDGAVTD